MSENPLAKLIRQADAVSNAASVLVSRSIREIRGELANLSGELNLAGSSDDRDVAYQMIRKKMAKLSRRLDSLLTAQNELAARQSAKAAAQMTGLEVKFSASRAKAIIELATPAQGENLAAVFTERMSARMIATLRESTVGALRQQAVEGGTLKELSKDMAERWTNALKGSTPEFTDQSGRVWDTKTYFQMNTRTNSMRIYNDSLVDNVARVTGSDLMRISSGGDPDCDCFAWEGCIISVSGQTKGFPTYEDARKGGCFHPNCTHTLEAVDETADAEEIALQKAHPVDADMASDATAQDDRRYEIDQARKMRDEGLTKEQARVAVDRDNLAASIRTGLVRGDAEDLVKRMTDAQVTALCPNGNPPSFVPAKGTKRKPEPERWNHGSMGGVVHIKRDADLAKILSVCKVDKPTKPVKPQNPPKSARVEPPKPKDDKSIDPKAKAVEPHFEAVSVPDFKTATEGMKFITEKLGVPTFGMEKMKPEFVKKAAVAVADVVARIGGDKSKLCGVWTYAEYYKQIYDFKYNQKLEEWSKCLGKSKDDPMAIQYATMATKASLKNCGVKKSSSNTYGSAWRWGGDGMERFNGVVINNRLDKMDRSEEVKSGFKAKGCEDPCSTLYHELGHILDNTLGLNGFGGFGGYSELTNSTIKRIFERGREAIKDGLSGYGAKNSKELIAEAWAEYKMNPNPREISLAIGREIDKLCYERLKK